MYLLEVPNSILKIFSGIMPYSTLHEALINMKSFVHVVLLLLTSNFVKSLRYENFPYEVSTFHEVARIHSHYRQHGQELKSHESGDNNSFIDLSGLLATFSQCLIHLINYNGVDFDLHVPVVLSRYDVVALKYLAIVSPPGESKSFRSSWRNRLIKFESGQPNSTRFHWCLRFWPTIECQEGPDILYEDKSISHKPWTCETQLYLTPPKPSSRHSLFYEFDENFSKIVLRVPGAFKRFWLHAINQTTRHAIHKRLHSDPDKLLYLATTRHRFEILLSENTPDVVDSWSTALTKIGHIYGLDDTYVSTNRELFYANLERNHGTNKLDIGLFYFLCRSCERCKFLVPIPIHSFSLGKITFASLVDKVAISQWQSGDNINMRIVGAGGFLKPFIESRYTIPPLHENEADFVRLVRLNMRHGQFENLRYHLDIRMLRAVVGNATVLPWPPNLASSSVCNGDAIHYSPVTVAYPIGKYDFAELYMHENKLRFVSCGNSPRESLAFNQLTNIFGLYVWMFIGISLVIYATLAVVAIRSNPKMYRAGRSSILGQPIYNQVISNILSYLKCLIEQGDPLNITVLKVPTMKYASIMYLLLAMVLSTCYKNENITNLTLPPEPIRYDTFKSLVENKFDIFTRAVFWGGIKEDQMENLSMFSNIQVFLRLIRPKQVHQDNTHRLSNLFYSELLDFVEGETVYKDLSVTVPNNLIISKEAGYLLNNTKLHPFWWDRLVEHTVSDFDLIKPCNRTALILPESEAYPLYYELRGLMKEKDIFINIDQLLSYQIGIRFLHWTTEQILTRARGLEESGVATWWHRFVVNGLTRISRNQTGSINTYVTNAASSKDPKASDMQSNIVVVFVVFIAGLVLAIVVLLIELAAEKTIMFWSKPTVESFQSIAYRLRVHLHHYYRQCTQCFEFGAHLYRWRVTKIFTASTHIGVKSIELIYV